MTHIIEDTVARLRDRITEGARLTSSYFQDHRTPFSPGEWYTAEKVSFDTTGRLAVTYLSYSEGGRTPERRKTFFDADDMIALADPSTNPNGRARLVLPGGYMDACDGGNLQTWDVYLADGRPLAKGVATTDGRAMLDRYAPEMIWVHKGDGKWTAQGYGRCWKVERGGRNLAFTAHDPMTRAWFYTLSTRPLDVEEWQEVKSGCASPEEAREAAPQS